LKDKIEKKKKRKKESSQFIVDPMEDLLCGFSSINLQDINKEKNNINPWVASHAALF